MSDQSPASTDLGPATFADDLLSRKEFASRFEQFILTEHRFVESALVITLHAPFGSGKSTFVRMWTNDLFDRRKADPTLPRPVVINAWETDYCGDPIIAILSALKDSLDDKSSPDPQPGKARDLKEAAKDIANFALGLVNGFVSDTTGLDPIEAGQFAEEKKGTRHRAAQFFPGNLFDVYEQKRAALKKLKTALAAAFQNGTARTLVIIDELDRCRPDYAVSYLETIKHIFDVHGIAFVLCVDQDQLRSAASVMFGEHIKFSEYYRKFSHRTVRLPELGAEDVERLTKNYVARYLTGNGKRKTVVHREFANNIGELVKAMSLAPRQAQELFRILGHTFQGPNRDFEPIHFGIAAQFMFLAALRVWDPHKYGDWSRGAVTPQDVSTLVTNLHFQPEHREFWMKAILSMMRATDEWVNATIHELRRSTIVSAPNFDGRALKDYFNDFRRHWDPADFPLGSKADKIERVTTFAS